MRRLLCRFVLWPAVAGALTVSSAAGAPPRAVVLITIDTLRADAVSFNGNPRGTTPYLDSLAARGTVFNHARAPSSWTPPSMASLFTGLYPTSHGIRSGEVTNQGQGSVVQKQPVLPASLVTLAEAFAAAGWRTFGVHSNLHLQTRLGFDQGFERYFDAPLFINATDVNRHAAALLASALGPQWRLHWRDRPVFLWVHYFDPHDPYLPRQPWFGRYSAGLSETAGQLPYFMTMRQLWQRYPRPDASTAARLRPLYESEVSFVDEQFRWLSRQLGLEDEDVLLVVTADHGEELADHGGLGHGGTLYGELIRVPLLVRWPKGVAEGLRVEAPVTLLDIFPTLVELCGLEAPQGAGTSLVPLLRTPGATLERQLFFEVDQPTATREDGRTLRPLIATVDGRWKLIRERTTREPSQLYDLLEDPAEQTDVAIHHPDLRRKLERSLKAWLDALPQAPADLRELEIEDEALRQQLKALGYID